MIDPQGFEVWLAVWCPIRAQTGHQLSKCECCTCNLCTNKPPLASRFPVLFKVKQLIAFLCQVRVTTSWYWLEFWKKSLWMYCLLTILMTYFQRRICKHFDCVYGKWSTNLVWFLSLSAWLYMPNLMQDEPLNKSRCCSECVQHCFIRGNYCPKIGNWLVALATSVTTYHSGSPFTKTL